MRLKPILILFLAGTLAVLYFFYDLRLEPKSGERNARHDSPVSTGGSAAGGAIDVYFSGTYANDPEQARLDGQSIDRKLAGAISAARSSVDCAFFELESASITEALLGAHRRGVTVRVVADSDYQENEEMQQIVAAGIPVVFDERSALMHNKFVVIDDATVWTGSFNATDNCAFRNNNNALLIRSGQLAANYATEFTEMFEHRLFGPRSPSSTPYPVLAVGESEIRCFFYPADEIADPLVELVSNARRSVHFLAFSYSDGELAETMIDRHRAGLDVQGVVESRGSGAGYASFAGLQKAGIDVLKDGNKYVMHHKVIIIDSLWTVVGSYNFSRAAAEANDENILFIKSAEVARQFEQEYGRIRAMAKVAG